MNALSLLGKWSLQSNEHKNLSVSFPGDIHSALLAQKIIPDPYWAKNELEIQWVGRTDWTTTRQIKVPKNFLKGRQFITLEGADTFVRVFINGKEAGLCSNFFRKWRFDVTDLLREGLNDVTLIFESSENYAVEAAGKLSMKFPYSQYDVTSPNHNLVRKVHCHSGWDWGPCIMAYGIYTDIRLEQTDTAFVDYIQTETTRKDDGSWNLHVKTWVTAIKNASAPVTVTVAAEPGVSATADFTPVVLELEKQQLKEGENCIEADLTVTGTAPWYAAGTNPENEDAAIAGGQKLTENPLYDVTVTCAKASKSVKIAFRELKVIAEEDERGKCLRFEVDGRPVFARGSNWIPCDALPSRQTAEKYDYLLTALVQANQNTVRVWGGGQYEKELFYELCDRKGIMVWQDMMFACSTYPANPEFLDTVRVEIREQIRRLSHHACIALWCGNNENLGALMWFPETRDNLLAYATLYDRLNEGTVGDEVKKNDASRIWWPSSPSAGPDDFSDNWHTDGRGDMHYWTVWHEKKPFEAYYDINPRFVSEFGYQSLPSLSEVRSFCPPDQLNLTSPIMEFHQRSVGGNSIIFENFSRYFRVPATFAHMSYLSQVQQAMAIKTAVTYWRSLRPVCMGSIIWQLNDVWPIASWSSIEYSGKWKMLHYASRHFCAPVALSLYKKGDTVYAYVLNDTRKELQATVDIAFCTFAGDSARDTVSVTKTIAPDTAELVWECKAAELGIRIDEAFLLGTLTVNGTVTAEEALFVDLQKHCQLEKTRVSVAVTETDDGFAVTLTAEKPAFYVALDQGGTQGTFSDNLLTLLPGKSKTVYFNQQALAGCRTWRKASLKTFMKNLTVTCLNDLY